MSQHPYRRPEFDTQSVISVNVSDSKKTAPTRAKLEQLSNARERALEARRIRQKNALETKLAQLRSLGDVSNEHLERTCNLLIEAEKEGRRRQNTLMTDLNTHLEEFGDQLLCIRRMLERIVPSTRSQVDRHASETVRRSTSPGRSRVSSVSTNSHRSSDNVRLVG